MPPRKSYLLRLSPQLYADVERWASDELRSVNAQIEYLLSDAVRRAGRKGSAPPAEPPARRVLK
ncbi:MAG: hypothetical protein Q8K63_11295 [Acidimicrobiales bacterium]|nr:hypothetical protein [Acidimicrobiales bacterium]